MTNIFCSIFCDIIEYDKYVVYFEIIFVVIYINYYIFQKKIKFVSSRKIMQINELNDNVH